MAEVKRASFAIEDMSESTSLADNFRAVITGGKFTKEAPSDSYTVEGNPIFGVANFEMPGDGPVEERRISQSFSLGAQSGDNFQISEDGQYLIPNNTEAAIRKDCKFGTFTASLQNEGVSKDIIRGFGWDLLTGLDGQWKRIADKERNFGEDKRTTDKKKSKFPPSTLCLVKKFADPGQKATGSSTGASTGSTNTGNAQSAAAPAAGGDFDLDTVTSDFIQQALTKKAPIQKSQITLLVSKAAIEHPKRADIGRRASDDGFLKFLAEAGVVGYDGKMISAAA